VNGQVEHNERTFVEGGLTYNQAVACVQLAGASVSGGTVEIGGKDSLYIRLWHPVGGEVVETSTLILRLETIRALASVCEEMLRAGSS